MLGIAAAKTQRGSAHQTLRPMSPDVAPKQSLSARYGLGAQPLHTDGAHLRKPPDVVALYAAARSPTATLIWAQPAVQHPDCARYGIFTVRNGRDSFLAPAVTGHTLRFDPACMTPADGYARDAVHYFAGLRPQPHHWTEPDTILVFDNRVCLHARAAVAAGDEGRALERLTFEWETPQA